MEGQGMTDYGELVKALRHCATRSNGCATCEGCPMSSENGDVIECINALHKDAADAIEALQAELPKRGKWKCSYPEIETNPMFMYGICSICGFEQSISNKLNYCPNCGAKMEVQE